MLSVGSWRNLVVETNRSIEGQGLKPLPLGYQADDPVLIFILSGRAIFSRLCAFFAPQLKSHGEHMGSRIAVKQPFRLRTAGVEVQEKGAP